MDKQKLIEAQKWIKNELDVCADFWLKNGMDKAPTKAPIPVPLAPSAPTVAAAVPIEPESDNVGKKSA